MPLVPFPTFWAGVPLRSKLPNLRKVLALRLKTLFRPLHAVELEMFLSRECFEVVRVVVGVISVDVVHVPAVGDWAVVVLVDFPVERLHAILDMATVRAIVPLIGELLGLRIPSEFDAAIDDCFDFGHVASRT